MVQKSSKRRGRPRTYDPDTALSQARDTFWHNGYSGTSLDDLSDATGMNRPSLYGAFGDKHALYLKALDQYREQARLGLARALQPSIPLAEGLARVYAGALGLYLGGDGPARGCFMIGTAAPEAPADEAVRSALRAGLAEIEDALQTRLGLAVENGELPKDADPAALATLASAFLHTLAVRARAGERRSTLEAIAKHAVAFICTGTSAR